MSKTIQTYTGAKIAQQKPAGRDGNAQSLRLLIQVFGHDPDLIPVVELDKFAARLSTVARKDPPWGWRYLRQVLNGNISASQRLVSAINALGAAYDGVPEILAGAHKMIVMAVGNVTPGAVVLADSRPCGNPACPVVFVPRSGSQRYCSPDCRRRARKTTGKAGAA